MGGDITHGPMCFTSPARWCRWPEYPGKNALCIPAGFHACSAQKQAGAGRAQPAQPPHKAACVHGASNPTAPPSTCCWALCRSTARIWSQTKPLLLRSRAPIRSQAVTDLTAHPNTALSIPTITPISQMGKQTQRGTITHLMPSAPSDGSGCCAPHSTCGLHHREEGTP